MPRQLTAAHRSRVPGRGRFPFGAGRPAARTSHYLTQRATAFRALLTAALTLMLGLPAAALSVLPAHGADTPLFVEDQTFNVRADWGMSHYLTSNGGDVDGSGVRWTTTGAPSWLDVQPNGYMTGIVPPAGGTFTFTITGTNGLYSGMPVSQSANATLVAAPVDPDIKFGGGGGGPRVEAGLKKTLYLAFPQKFGVGAMITYPRDAVWSATGLPPGLTFSADGMITGRATRAGTFPMTVTLTYNGIVATKTLTLTTTSGMLISTGGFGRFPRVTVGRPFAIKMRVHGNVGKTTLSFAAKRPAGYKLKRTSSSTYTLTGKPTSRKKVRVPLKMVDRSGTYVIEKLVVTPYPK